MKKKSERIKKKKKKLMEAFGVRVELTAAGHHVGAKSRENYVLSTSNTEYRIVVRYVL